MSVIPGYINPISCHRVPRPIPIIQNPGEIAILKAQKYKPCARQVPLAPNHSPVFVKVSRTKSNAVLTLYAIKLQCTVHPVIPERKNRKKNKNWKKERMKERKGRRKTRTLFPVECPYAISMLIFFPKCHAVLCKYQKAILEERKAAESEPAISLRLVNYRSYRVRSSF
jgi:hypothetical protein